MRFETIALGKPGVFYFKILDIRSDHSNWEMASGLPARHRIAWFYVPITFTLGWFIAPGKIRAAFSAGRGRYNLYKLRIGRDQLMAMKVSDLRKLLDAPA